VSVTHRRVNVVDDVVPRTGWGAGWQHGRELLVADDAEAMAPARVALHQDERLWERQRSAALDALMRDFSPAAFDAAVARVACA